MGKSRGSQLSASQPVPIIPQGHGIEPVRYSWRQLGIGFLVFLMLAGLWWYIARPRYLVHQAQVLLEGDPDQAASLLQEVVNSAWGGNREAEVLWARALVRSGRWEEAIGCFSQIHSPELAEGAELLRLADDAIEKNVPILAVMTLEAIPPHQTHRSEAIERLISIRQRQGDVTQVLKLGSEWAQLQPENPAPWGMMAAIHEQQMSLTSAAKDYQEALSRQKKGEQRVETLQALVRLLIHLGERAEARSRLDELLHLNVKFSIVDQLLDAQLRRLEGNFDGALSQVENVLRADPDHLIAIELRGTLAMDRADPAAAALDFQRVLEQQPWNQQSQYKLSQCLMKLGREGEAMIHLRESHRLIGLSNRILELIGSEKLTTAERMEMATALEQTGLKTAAERWRQRIYP